MAQESNESESGSIYDEVDHESDKELNTNSSRLIDDPQELNESESVSIYDQVYHESDQELITNSSRLIDDPLFEDLNLNRTLLELNRPYLLDLLDKLTSRTRHKTPWFQLAQRIFFPALILFFILLNFILFYSKCSFTPQSVRVLNNSKYLSSFSKIETVSANTSIQLLIPYCSCLFMDGKYGQDYTAFGWVFSIVKNYYLANEILILTSLNLNKVFRNVRITLKASKFTEYNNKFCLYFLVFLTYVLIIVVYIFITQIVTLAVYLIIEMVYLVINLISNPENYVHFILQLKEVFTRVWLQFYR
jgi:hypothetical protein